MFPRDVLAEAGGFPEGEILAEDWDTWSRVALRYRIAFSPAVGFWAALSVTGRSATAQPDTSRPATAHRTGMIVFMGLVFMGHLVL